MSHLIHSGNIMEQRLTLVSDPTDEFPNNVNTRFKMRIPNGLRLEGKGWQVALLSLTLPNSDAVTAPFVSGINHTVIRTRWSTAHYKDYRHGKYNALDRLAGASTVNATHVSGATSGVEYWNRVVQAHERQVMDHTYNLRKTLIKPSTDPTPMVLLKQTLCPTFRWEGEDLIMERRAADVTNGSNNANVLYSAFDMAYEVALQWGFIGVKPDGNVIAGPNLQLKLFDDLITPLYPVRSRGLNRHGLHSYNGSVCLADLNKDRPRGDDSGLRGISGYDIMWYYTRVYNGKTEQLVRLSGMFEWRFTNLNATFDKLHKHVGQTVMVHSNLQQTNLVGPSKIPLLRQLEIPYAKESGHTYTEPTQLEWLPVATHQTDIVEVQLRGVEGQLLQLPQGKSLVTVMLTQTV